jgi:hypothetical protein
VIDQLLLSGPAGATASPQLLTKHDEATGARVARHQRRQNSGTRS